MTTKQLNTAANSIAKDSSGESRSAKTEMALLLFPDDRVAILNAIYNHPINQRWDEYIKASPQEQALFLLPEA